MLRKPNRQARVHQAARAQVAVHSLVQAAKRAVHHQHHQLKQVIQKHQHLWEEN